MKLSKQERIGLMIIVAVVILALGAFLMVKPKIEEMNLNKETMQKTQKDFDEKDAKVKTKAALRDQILDAYKEGVQKADMFFTEMRPYEADDMFREFLEKRKYVAQEGQSAKGHEGQANVLIEELKVGEPETVTLVASFPELEGVTYPLKEFATQGGVTLSEKEEAELERKSQLQSILGDGQTIGATTIEYTVKAISQEELIKFSDELNNFVRKENGNDVRKAMMISGIAITYPDITTLYDDMADEQAEKALEAAEVEFERVTGHKLNTNTGTSGNVPTPIPDAEGSDSNNSELDEYVFGVETTLRLYSVERMQDPTPILNAQDGI